MASIGGQQLEHGVQVVFCVCVRVCVLCVCLSIIHECVYM